MEVHARCRFKIRNIFTTTYTSCVDLTKHVGLQGALQRTNSNLPARSEIIIVSGENRCGSRNEMA